MSKLAHSHQPTMDRLSVEQAIENGNEDLVGLKLILSPNCQAPLRPKWYRERIEICSRRAKYETRDGAQLCKIHAIQFVLGTMWRPE